MTKEDIKEDLSADDTAPTSTPVEMTIIDAAPAEVWQSGLHGVPILILA